MRGMFLHVKIQLPNGEKKTLDENLPLWQKKRLVENLTNQFHPTLIKNWDSNSVRFFLDGLANYLVWHKEEEDRNKQDKEVLSIKKVEHMEGKRKSKTIPFSKLTTLQKESIGLDGANNE